MNTATTFSIAQLQQLSKEGYLGTWRFERWLNVISAVEGFLPKLEEYDTSDNVKEFNTRWELNTLVHNACVTDSINKGLDEAYGCELKADIAFDSWCYYVTYEILESGIERLIELAIDDSEHSGFGWVEACAINDVEINYEYEQEQKAA